MKEKGEIIGTAAAVAVVIVIVAVAGSGIYYRMEDEAVEDPDLPEGVYVGYSDADEHGYVEAEVVTEEGSIVDVELTEYDERGFAKDEDYDWEEFHEAMEVLPERFVEADHHDVEIVTGATTTSEKAMEAVERALERSEGYEGPFDGTFFGASDIVEERNTRNVAWITVEDGDVVEVDIEEYGDVYEGELKGEDYDWDEFHEAIEVLPERFVEEDGPDVEVVTGATGSTERWSQAVERALLKAGAL